MVANVPKCPMDLDILGGNMKIAKCYLKRGWWKHYRTEDGHAFSVRDDKDYWYDGNVFTNDKTNECYIPKEKHEVLFLQIKFEV